MSDFISSNEMWVFVLVFSRIGSAVSVLPLFGSQAVPMRVRLAIALVLSYVLTWTLSIHDTPDVTRIDLFDIVSEMLIGLALGLFVRLILISIQMAGTMAAQSTSLSQVFGTASSEPMPALGHLFTYGSVAMLAAVGFHLEIIDYLNQFYQVVPMTSEIPIADFAEWIIGVVQLCFELAFVLALPFFSISLLYNVSIGFINKAMPQLMVAFVGAPLITLMSLALMALLTPVIFTLWHSNLSSLLSNPTESLF